MMVYMREYRDFFEESIQIDKQIAVPVIWYEADINYSDGYRALHRILYSNDGLIFVTYDHYKTFVEIV